MNNAPNPDFLGEEIDSVSSESVSELYWLKDAIELGNISEIKQHYNGLIRKIDYLIELYEQN